MIQIKYMTYFNLIGIKDAKTHHFQPGLLRRRTAFPCQMGWCLSNLG